MAYNGYLGANQNTGENRFGRRLDVDLDAAPPPFQSFVDFMRVAENEGDSVKMVDRPLII